VDGVIRVFSILKRDMVAQYKLSGLSKGITEPWKTKLKDVGRGSGGFGMISGFEGGGSVMTVSLGLVLRITGA
jgi:hypothetical protein